MLIEAQKRIPKENTLALRLEELDSLEGDFTLLFSNFGGINCLNHAQMKSFLKSAADKLEEGGTLVLVVMGKRCIWDRFYLRLKGKKSEIKRRDTNSGVEIPITGGTVTTWYYAPKELIALSTENFTVRTIKPIGLFVPPSYLAPFFDRRKRSFGFLKFMDRLFRFPRCSNFSDHYYLSLRKK